MKKWNIIGTLSRIIFGESMITCVDNVDTRSHIHPMNKHSTIVPSADTKGSINLRIESQTRQLIDEAATALGKTRTEFMIDLARRVAIDVLLDQRLFVLDDAAFDSFAQALETAPAPGPKLKYLMRRQPVWKA